MNVHKFDECIKPLVLKVHRLGVVRCRGSRIIVNIKARFSCVIRDVCKCSKLVVYSIQGGSNLNYGMLM
jgi:hypothetical protein